MHQRRLIAGGALAALLSLAVGAAQAQDFPPKKPVVMVVGFAAGGVIATATDRPSALIIGAVMQTLVPMAMFGGARIWRHRTIAAAVASDTRAAAR